MSLTKEDTIRLAREAGLVPLNVECDPTYIPVIERFAELVRKEYSFTHAQMWLKRFDDAIKAEREACARVCEQSDEDGEGPDCWDWHSKDYAAAIRAREGMSDYQNQRPRQWLGLTNDERRIVIDQWDWEEGKPDYLCRLTEAKLREKNGYN